ncbi:hypothetical protein M434DRAFT_33391 [Hypoxylon sp. CO27-5]|nr:hypothetical protein M434DRAFT_33391 [Hypoxylon sp. CO27-5]
MASTTTLAQIYNFSTEFIENLHVLPNGQLLLTTMESPTGHLYTLDPKASEPQAKLVTSFDSNVTALTGIAPLPDCDGDLYAVSGGLHTSFAFEKGSMRVYIVSLKLGSVVDSIPVPDAATMNGMAALPHYPNLLVSADSISGRILSIDTRTHKVGVVMEDAALGPGAHNSSSRVPPIGINGLRVRGNYIYFTNSSQGTFMRVRIDQRGSPIGEPKLLARSPDILQIYDDFTFDDEGNAYVAVHSTEVFKITPDGMQTVLAGGGSGSLLKEPTSVALANDGKSIYVSTGGNFRATPREGGQVVQIQL